MLLARQGSGKELPIFFGDAHDWPVFISNFQRSTATCGFSQDENMLRLKKSLRERARETVGPLLALPGNVEVIIKSLERRFGRPNVVISNMIEKIRDMQLIRDEEPESIMELSNGVMGLVVTMNFLNTTGHVYNPHLLQEFVWKLSPTLRLQ